MTIFVAEKEFHHVYVPPIPVDGHSDFYNLATVNSSALTNDVQASLWHIDSISFCREMRWHRVVARMARLLHEQCFWEHSQDPFPITFSASPCHGGLVERANHMEKHILLISPSHGWFPQESLPSHPHANFLIWLSMVALTVSCDFLAVTDTLGDPRPEVCHPAPRAFMVPVRA